MALANLKALAMFAYCCEDFAQSLLEDDRWRNPSSTSRSRDKSLMKQYGVIWWVDEHGALSLKNVYDYQADRGNDRVVGQMEVIRIEVCGCCGDIVGLGSINENGSFVEGPRARFKLTQ